MIANHYKINIYKILSEKTEYKIPYVFCGDNGSSQIWEFEKRLKLKIKMGRGLGNFCIRKYPPAPQNQNKPTCMDLVNAYQNVS